MNTALLLGCLTWAASGVLQHSGLRWDWEAVGAYWKLFAAGWGTTVAVSLGALALSTILGVLVALAQRSRLLILRYAAKGYVELVRGTPLLAQIYILFYIVAEAVHLENRTVAGVLTLSLFSGAYLAEVFRGGIESVGRSQLESAQAIGLTRAQTYRHIILPQALRVVLPALSGQFVSLIKDSSLLSVIGLNELTQSARNVASYTFSNFESYLLLAAGYLVLTLPISLWTRWLETHFRYET
ncbi:MAG: amino acid ABC transporter permease [Verrucomicrobia bacterium]|nr:amino acid ABC transporter permease [Verrucomicrobiota bacterium]